MTRLSASQSNRGMGLEQLINYSNEVYRTRGHAVVYKRPTPVKILRTQGSRIVNAHLESPSTVDYEGVYRGHSLQFEAKSTRVASRFDLKNFHEHQIEHLKSCMNHGAIAFVIVEFAGTDERFFVPASLIIKTWDDQADGGAKSIRYEDFAQWCQRIPSGRGVPVDYLIAVDKLLGSQTA